MCSINKLLGTESCKIVFLGGHFLFICSDTIAVGCTVLPQCTLQTDGRTERHMTVLRQQPILVCAVWSAKHFYKLTIEVYWERVREMRMTRNTVFHGKFFQIPRTSLPNSVAHHGKFSNYSRWFSTAPKLDQICSIFSPYKPQLTDIVCLQKTGNISDKLSSFSILFPLESKCFMNTWQNHVYIQYLITYGCLNCLLITG